MYLCVCGGATYFLMIVFECMSVCGACGCLHQSHCVREPSLVGPGEPTSGCGKCSSAFLSLQRNSALRQNGRKLPPCTLIDRRKTTQTGSLTTSPACPSHTAVCWHRQPSVEFSTETTKHAAKWVKRPVIRWR